MIGVWTLLTISASMFQLTLSNPYYSRDLLPPTRTNTQDISEGAPDYLLPVSGGLQNRRLLWLWGNDDKDESDTPTSTTTRVPYADGAMTTERPPWWRRGIAKMSRGMTKVGDAFKELGTDIKEAANATKWKMKAAGRTVKNAFKKGYRKIKMKIKGVDDKFNNFANRLKIQVENGNENALRILQKLGIIVRVEDKNVIGVDVEDEIDSVSNILKEEGVLKEKSTTNLETVTPHYIVTNVITQSLPVTDNVDSDILSTSKGISTTVDNMSDISLTNIPNSSRTSKTESNANFTEYNPTEGYTITNTLFPSKITKTFTNTPTRNYVDDITSSTSIITDDPKNMDIIDSNTEFTTKIERWTNSDITASPASTTKYTENTSIYTADIKDVSSTVKTDSTRETNEIAHEDIPIESSSVEEKVEEEDVRIDSEHSTMTASIIAEKSTTKHTENVHVTDLVGPLVYTTRTVTVTNKIFTTETPKKTTKIVEVEQPFKTDSPSILEEAYYEKDTPIESSPMEEVEEEEVYSPPPFPDVFHDSRVKDRLMELYEKGDFTHSELADLFDPDYYEYYYDYS